MNNQRLKEAEALFWYIYDIRWGLLREVLTGRMERLDALAWTYFRHLCDALGLPYSAMEAKLDSRPLGEILKGA